MLTKQEKDIQSYHSISKMKKLEKAFPSLKEMGQRPNYPLKWIDNWILASGANNCDFNCILHSYGWRLLYVNISVTCTGLSRRLRFNSISRPMACFRSSISIIWRKNNISFVICLGWVTFIEIGNIYWKINVTYNYFWCKLYKSNWWTEQTDLKRINQKNNLTFDLQLCLR